MVARPGDKRKSGVVGLPTSFPSGFPAGFPNEANAAFRGRERSPVRYSGKMMKTKDVGGVEYRPPIKSMSSCLS